MNHSELVSTILGWAVREARAAGADEHSLWVDEAGDVVRWMPPDYGDLDSRVSFCPDRLIAWLEQGDHGLGVELAGKLIACCHEEIECESRPSLPRLVRAAFGAERHQNFQEVEPALVPLVRWGVLVEVFGLRGLQPAVVGR